MEEQKKVEIVKKLHYGGKTIEFPIEITLPSAGKGKVKGTECSLLFSIIEQLVNAFPKERKEN